MRILIQHPHRKEEISGVLTCVKYLENGLAGREGVLCRVISSKETRLGEQLRLVWWADVVQFNSNCLAMVLFAKMIGRRTLLKVHSLHYGSVYYRYRPMSFLRRHAVEVKSLAGKSKRPVSLRYFVESIARLVLRTAIALCVDRVAACSRFAAEAVSLPRVVSTLYNPLAIAPGRPPRELAALARPFAFVFLGRICFDKGCDLIIRAVRVLKDERRAFVVHLIGDGPDLAAMQALARRQGVADHVVFLGKLAHGAIFTHIEQALAVVVPSRWQEPAGYTTVEAASCGTAVIAARSGGLPETGGPACLYFTRGSFMGLADCMRQCLDHPQDAMARGHSSYLWAGQRFSPEATTTEFLRLCR